MSLAKVKDNIHLWWESLMKQPTPAPKYRAVQSALLVATFIGVSIFYEKGSPLFDYLPKDKDSK